VAGDPAAIDNPTGTNMNVFYRDTSGNLVDEFWINTVGWDNQTLGSVYGPGFTNNDSATMTVGIAGSFLITSTGDPTATLSESGSLPNGITFVDNLNDTATLAGTPATSSGGVYPLEFTSSNGVGSSATQSFTLTVDEPPSITSSNQATFTVGSADTFTVTTGVGFPTPAMSETGSLPKGVNLTDNGNGTATLAGTAVAGTAGTYPITVTASNGISPDATQSFTLTVLAIDITTMSLPSGTLKTPYMATLTASGGNPPYRWSLASGSGPLPPGLKLKATGVISGRPKKAGTYSFTVQVVDTRTKTKPHTHNTATQPLSITIS